MRGAHTLLGQNVNAYHGVSPAGGEWRLAELIRELAEIPNLEKGCAIPPRILAI